MSLIVVLVGFWFLIATLDWILKKTRPHEYGYILNVCGISRTPVSITWTWNSPAILNRLLSLLSHKCPKLVKIWFNIGTIITVVLIVPSFYIILNTVLSFFPAKGYWNSQSTSNAPSIPHSESNYSLPNHAYSYQRLEPVLPGVNLPLSDTAYYLVALLACSIFHELGHALAAVREGVKLMGVGVFFMILIPGAFVHLPPDLVNSCTTRARLRIFTGGVWHNVALSGVCALLLLLHPLANTSLYVNHNGLFVHSILPNSGLVGERGLEESDRIVAINECHIRAERDWIKCTQQLLETPPRGYCVPKSLLDNSSQLDVKQNCCEVNVIDSAGLCFLERIADATGNSSSKAAERCLVVRSLLRDSPSRCGSSPECASDIGSDYVCVEPRLFQDERIIEIRRVPASDNGPPPLDVLYVGHPLALAYALQLGEYSPRQMSFLRILTPQWVAKLLKYIVTFSVALAILNCIPCYYLDGDWICGALVDHLAATRISAPKRKRIKQAVNWCGTLSLAGCLILSIYSFANK